MSKLSELTNNANWNELMDVAKQAIADCCSIKPEDVRVDEDGDIGYDDPSGSASVYLGAEIDPPAFVLRSFVLSEVEDKPLVYRVLNEINKDLTLGQLYYIDDRVMFYYRLLVDDPTPDLLTYVLNEVLALVDHYDDGLKARLGGERFYESTEDEIEV